MSATAPTRVLLLGGTSEIGLAIVRRLAADGPIRPFLLGRDRARLDAALAQLEQAGAVAGGAAGLDAEDLPSHEHVIGDAFTEAGGFDVVVLAIGALGAQAGLEAPRQDAAEIMRVNFLGCGSLLLECMRRLQGRRARIVVLSSVAGERVRASNAVYGAAKAGLDALAQGLGDATAASGPRVLIVRPGFVRTRMTAGLQPAPMSTTADEVAEATVRALGGSSSIVWVPGRLRFVFMVLRHLPRSIFRKLPL